MRVWDIHPSKLCRNHLLGEHRELHAMWSVLVNNKTGYSKHPETLRWVGKLSALYARHESLVKEMHSRNYSHNSPLDKSLATGSPIQDTYVNTVEEQIQILRNKKCACKV